MTLKKTTAYSPRLEKWRPSAAALLCTVGLAAWRLGAVTHTTQSFTPWPTASPREGESLLVCICSSAFGRGERLAYLLQVIRRLLDTYRVPLHIIIDTDSPALSAALPPRWLWSGDVEVVVHAGLAHPWQLTWKHREHMARLIQRYGQFMYIEDDIDVPFETYQRYIHNFDLLWPAMVPCLIRVEMASNGSEYLTDYYTHEPINVTGSMFTRGLQRFAARPWGYSAAWIMPGTALRTSLMANFTQSPPAGSHFQRVEAASYPWWFSQLNKPLGLELNATALKFIDRRSLIFHVSNSYLDDPPPHASLGGLLVL